MKMPWMRAALLLAAGIGSSIPARAAQITVNTELDDYKQNGQCDLREAVQAANSDSNSHETKCTAGSGNDTIVFDASLTGKTIKLNPALGWINLSSDMTIRGKATINGSKAVRIFRIGSSFTINLEKLTLEDGYVEGSGAALHVDSTSAVVTITNSIFGYNEAFEGGAIASSGDLTVKDSEFKHNTAQRGGAVKVGYKAKFERSDFFTNYAKWGGGGIYCSSGDLTVTETSFHLNQASGGASPSGAVDGGGAISTGCKSKIETTLFLRNMAFGPVGGGAMLVQKGDLVTVERSIFQENYAGGSDEHALTLGGGAIHDQGQMDVHRSVFNKNVARGLLGGGGIYFNDASSKVVNSSFIRNTSTMDNFSPIEMPPFDPMPKTLSNGAAISASGFALVEIVASTLSANEGESELFYMLGLGNGGVRLRNTIIGGELANSTCDGDVAFIEGNPGGNPGHNLQSDLAADPACVGVPVKKLNLKYDTSGSFGVSTDAGPLDFAFWKPDTGSAALGGGNPVVCSGLLVQSKDLIGKMRADVCTVGAIE